MAALKAASRERGRDWNATCYDGLRTISFLISGNVHLGYYHLLGAVRVGSVVQNNGHVTYDYWYYRQNFRHRCVPVQCLRTLLWVCSIPDYESNDEVKIDWYLCKLAVLWLALSFTVCDSSMRGRILEEPARESRAALNGTSAWTALLGDGGRLLRARNGEDGAERKPCCWSDILWSGSKGLRHVLIHIKWD